MYKKEVIYERQKKCHKCSTQPTDLTFFMGAIYTYILCMLVVITTQAIIVN